MFDLKVPNSQQGSGKFGSTFDVADGEGGIEKSKRFASSCDVNESDYKDRAVLGGLLARAKSFLDPCEMSGWYSLSGYLNLKFLGGGITILIRSKKRYYFVLDEINCQLAYYKEYEDIGRKKSPTGNIELKNSAVTLNENKPCIFTLHTMGGRQYELEAESEESAIVWVECLQKRSTYKRDIMSENVTHRESSLALTDFMVDEASTSVQSEPDLAAALDVSAHSATVQPNTSIHSPAPPPAKECSFYFGSPPSSVNISPDDPHSPPASLIGDPLGTMAGINDTSAVTSPPSAASLHFWVNQWLCKQDIDINRKESMLSNNVSDYRHCLPSGTISSATSFIATEDNYIRLEDSRENSEMVKELELYKRIDQSQKLQIEELTLQLKKLSHQMKEMEKHSNDDPEAKARYFQQQNKCLNAEVIRLSLALHAEAEEKAQLTGALYDLQKRLDQLKTDYAFLLQCCLRVQVSERRNESTELKLLSFDTHKEHIVQLLMEARKLDPSLPTWDSLLSPGTGYVDAYGFRNVFTDAGLALHYAATQLVTFYQNTNDHDKRERWKEYLRQIRHGLTNTREARTLARAGIPARYRSAIWRCLVHQKVADMKSKYGKYYFRGLCSWHSSSNDLNVDPTHQKQISLDLMRTMPNNVHFNAPSQKGVVQLQAVLQAICAHNPTIGYCQGMNFVAAICLLFLNAEDTFWFLVALTERYFVPNYFDHTLTGAQADQEVLKDILEEKLPDLSKHFQQRDIELTTVTLNWYLALFYDSLPFETLLRIWDCFLLEGPKVLFRFALALLYMHGKTLMECNDTMSILKALKLSAKHTYDVETLVKIAFETLKPFPRRQELIKRQTKYMELLRVRLQKKDELKAATLASNNLRDVVCQVEVVISLTGDDLLLCYCCLNGVRKLACISGQTGQMRDLDQRYDCAVVNAATVSTGNIVFLALISGDIVSVSVDIAGKTSMVNWRKKLADVVLQLACCDDGRLYAAMANGTLAAFENALDLSEPGALQLYYIPIGAAPLSCVCLVEDGTQIWCGMGGKLVILNAKTLDCLERLTIATSTVGYIPAVFERLLCLQWTQFGVWMATFNSPLIQLWDPVSLTCKMVFDTSSDHQSLHTQIESRITSMLAFDSCVWVGTEDGYILVYDVTHRHASPRPTDRKSSRLHVTDHHSHSNRTSPRSGRNKHASGMSPSRQRTVTVTDGHRDSGYSGTSSSRCASTEKLHHILPVEAASTSRPRSRTLLVPKSRETEETKRWQSCLSLAQRRALLTATATRSVDLADSDASRVRPRRKYASAVVNASRRRDWLYARARASTDTPPSCYTSLETTSGARGLEYDDFFVLYPEPEPSAGSSAAAGGLLGGCVAKAHSDWSLAITPTARMDGRAPGSPTFTDSSTMTSAWSTRGNADGTGKKKRRQFLRRPTRKDLKRRDLDLDEYSYLSSLQIRNTGAPTPTLSRQSTLKLPQTVAEGDTDNESGGIDVSDTASVLSLPTSAVLEPPYPYRLQCIMRLKIADKPIRGLILSKGNDKKQRIISCAGKLDENEAILIWSKDANDPKLWVPKPLTMVSERSRSLPQAGTAKRHLVRRSTSPWFRNGS